MGDPALSFAELKRRRNCFISDNDLGQYLCDCLDDLSRQNRVFPIGGPGEAITPRQQGEHLLHLLGRAPQFQQVPVAVLDADATPSTGTERLFDFYARVIAGEATVERRDHAVF